MNKGRKVESTGLWEALEPLQVESWIQPPLKDVWYLTGATASGKSNLALELAERMGAEILSVDSMAVYCGMDIGTAKPDVTMQRRVAHHLIDLVEPTEEFSVSQYVLAAHRKAAEVRSRGKQVLLVGGTPLYLKTLLRGMFLGPPGDPDFRAEVEREVERYGIESLRQRLWQVDPLAAHRILPGDWRRMIRALEVAKATGRPLSHWQTQFERVDLQLRHRAFVLQWPREQIHRRVNQRVHQMILDGLVDEVKGLKERFGSLGRTASQAVGYQEIAQVLDGSLSLEEAIPKIQARSRQFVRRQEIWFRSIDELTGVDAGSDHLADSLFQSILQRQEEG
jgi:tRNA dimethylallyltransferase